MGESNRGMRIVKVSAELLFCGIFGSYQREPDSGIRVTRIGVDSDMTPLPQDVKVERMLPIWGTCDFGQRYQVMLSSSRWEPVPAGVPIPEIIIHCEHRIIDANPDAVAGIVAARVQFEISRVERPSEVELLAVTLSDASPATVVDDLLKWFNAGGPSGFLLMMHAGDHIETITPKAGDLVTISTGADLTEVDIYHGERMLEEKFPGVRFMILPAGAEVENHGPVLGTQEWTEAEIAALKAKFHERHGGKDHGPAIIMPGRSPEITMGFDPAGMTTDPAASPYVQLATWEAEAGEQPTLNGYPIHFVDRIDVPRDAQGKFHTLPEIAAGAITHNEARMMAGRQFSHGTLGDDTVGPAGDLPLPDSLVGAAAGAITDEARAHGQWGQWIGEEQAIETTALAPCPFCQGKRDAAHKCAGCGRISHVPGDPTNPDEDAGTT